MSPERTPQEDRALTVRALQRNAAELTAALARWKETHPDALDVRERIQRELTRVRGLLAELGEPGEPR